MPRRPTRPRRETRLTAKMTIEDLNAIVDPDPASLVRVYGTLEAARARYDHLVETGQERRSPGQLPLPVWWFTEPGVPDDLRGIKDPDNAWDDDVWDALEADRWRWLAQTGRVTDADRAAIAKSAALSPNFRRLQRIAEAVK